MATTRAIWLYSRGGCAKTFGSVVGPKDADLGLICGAGRGRRNAVAAEILHLVIGSGIFGTVDRRRRRRQISRGAINAKRRDLAPLGIERRLGYTGNCLRYRVGLIFADARDDFVVRFGIGAVVRAVGQNCFGHDFTECDAHVLAGTIGNLAKPGAEIRVDCGFLFFVERHQGVVSRFADGGIDVRILHADDLDQVRFVLAKNRVDGVVHGHADDGQRLGSARRPKLFLQAAGTVIGADSLQRNVVPVQHGIGVAAGHHGARLKLFEASAASVSVRALQCCRQRCGPSGSKTKQYHGCILTERSPASVYANCMLRLCKPRFAGLQVSGPNAVNFFVRTASKLKQLDQLRELIGS